MKRHLVLAVLGLLAGAGAQAADTVYRCGPEGRVTYSNQPCEGGRAFDAADPRSEAQRAAARRVAQREGEAGAALARENREREAAEAKAVRGQRPAGIGATAGAQDAQASKPKRPADKPEKARKRKAGKPPKGAASGTAFWKP